MGGRFCPPSSTLPSGTTGDFVTQSIASGSAYSGNKSLKVTTTASGASNGVKSSSFSVGAGEAVTFSAYVKTSGTYAYLALSDGSTTPKTYISAGSGWTRYEVTYTNSTSYAKTVTAQLLVGSVGTVYMDCAQAEKAVTASRYNLITNGDFRYGAFGWTNSGGFTASTGSAPAEQLDSSTYSVTGSPTAQKRMTQTLSISGSTGDTYVLTGWAQGDAVPLRDLNDAENESRQFAVLLTFHYTDGTTGDFVARFNPDTDSWQYAAQVAVAKSAYSSITVSLAYDYNANTVRFDGIQLYKEEFGSSYTYDADGNVKSVMDLQKQTTSYEYNTDGELTQILQNNKAKMTYTYDDWHNVKTAVSEEGISYEFTYDGYGNNTVVSIVGGGEKITSTAVYTADGNRLQATTDALGKTTTYSYNANTNVLEWVQYPNDTTATRTNYSYDSMYRAASAAVTTNTGNALSASYTYEDDLLTQIETESTTYTFTYGNFASLPRSTTGSSATILTVCVQSGTTAMEPSTPTTTAAVS